MAAGATDAACDATSRRMAAPGGLHIFGMKKGKWEGAHRSARAMTAFYTTAQPCAIRIQAISAVIF